MTTYWTRAEHAELPDAVMPVDAVESYPGWTAVGEPADNPDVLHAAIEREQFLAALDGPAVTPPAAPVPTPSASKTGAGTPESSAPAGADPKE
jgi:hypothetical protein